MVRTRATTTRAFLRDGRSASRRQSGRTVTRRPPKPISRPGRSRKRDAEPEFDLSSLPKLEDMTGATDITGFLRKGVPEHLRNAALRKSWALDPAIRNYVNPALEYAYDWNTPGGVPGTSEIGAGMDVARLVSQIMGSGESLRAFEPRQSTPEMSRRAIPCNPRQMMHCKNPRRICRPRR